MARTTKQLSGGGKDKLIREMIAMETTVPREAAARLSDTMCASIKAIRVDIDVWDSYRLARPTASTPVPLVPPHPADAAVPAMPQPADPSANAIPPFDPYAFSALSVLAKGGADELQRRLSLIGSAADLHTLAKAQHLAIDAGLVDVQDVRTAIQAATLARLAERKAAAS